MVRIVASGLAGGLVYYVWGMLSWMVLPLHVSSMGTMPDEAAVTAALTAQGLESGVYAVPWTDDEDAWSDPESQWTKRHLAGPLYTVFYHRGGGPPMDPKAMIGGLVVDLLGALVAAALLAAALPRCPAFWHRLLFVTGLGAFVAIIAHLGYWNWMHFSTAWTLGFVVDSVVGWALAGAVMAAILKPSSR